MNAQANTLELNVVRMAKKLAVVTILGLAWFQANAAPSPANMRVNHAQAIVNQEFEHLQYAGELSGPQLSKGFAKALKHSGFSTKTVLLKKASGAAEIRIRGAQALDFHVVTIVHLIGGWRVVDPIVLQTAKLEPFKLWQRRIQSPVDMSAR